MPGFTRFQDAIQPLSLPHPHYETLCKTSEGIYGTLDALFYLSEVKMISVQNVSPLGSDCNFVVDLLVDGKLQTYRLAVKPKVTRPVSMLEMLMQHAPELGYCIVLQMHVVSAHQERHVVVRDCTPLASW